MQKIPCPVCGAPAPPVFIVGCDLLHHVPGEFTLVRCECGLVYVNPQPDNNELAAYYPDDYLAHRETRRTPRLKKHGFLKRLLLRWYYGCPVAGWAPPRVLRWLARPILFWFSLGTLKTMIPYHGQGRILDVGCGNGGWLMGLKEAGWEVQGVEIDAAAAEHADEAGIPVKCGTLRDAQFPEASFDVVRLHYVFEHLINPGETLDEIRRILAPGGICYIRIPNIDSTTFTLFGYYWFPLDVPRHVFHYTPKSFKRLAQAHGLRVVRTHFKSPPSGFFTSIEFMREAGVLPWLLRPLREQSAFWRNVWRPIGWVIDRLGKGDIVEYTLRCAAPQRR